MKNCIFRDSPKASALNLYSGAFYKPLEPHKDEILKNIFSGRLRLMILSAGYGLLDALEPIHDYEAVMMRENARHWKNSHLTQVISELILYEKPAHVYGFFAGKGGWGFGGSKYRFFFTSGLKHAMGEGYKSGLSGCFYRKEGRGVNAILGSLGKTFIEFMKTGFDESYVYEIERRGRKWDNVVIGFERVTS